MCYDRRVLQVHQVLCIPSRLAQFFSWALEPIFSSSEPTSEARVGMGATVDIQRQQRMEQLDRQLMLSQFAQVRRQRQQQVRWRDQRCALPPAMTGESVWQPQLYSCASHQSCDGFAGEGEHRSVLLSASGVSVVLFLR